MPLSWRLLLLIYAIRCLAPVLAENKPLDVDLSTKGTGEILIIHNLERNSSAISHHFQRNREQNFSWHDPAIQHALARKNINSVHKPPHTRPVKKRADNENSPAIQDPQCLICPSADGGQMSLAAMSTAWLQKQQLPNVGTKDKCLFYTQRILKPVDMATQYPGVDTSLSTIATKYACLEGLTTIWMLYPYESLNTVGADGRDFFSVYQPGSWLHWLAGDEVSRQIYFENMSEAMAQSCSGTIYVMSDTPKTVTKGGIWGSKEWPVVRANAAAGIVSDLYSVDSGLIGTQGTKYYLNAKTLNVIANSQRRGTSANTTAILLDIEYIKQRIARMTQQERDNCDYPSQFEPYGEDWFG